MVICIFIKKIILVYYFAANLVFNGIVFKIFLKNVIIKKCINS